MWNFNIGGRGGGGGAVAWIQITCALGDKSYLEYHSGHLKNIQLVVQIKFRVTK